MSQPRKACTAEQARVLRENVFKMVRVGTRAVQIYGVNESSPIDPEAGPLEYTASVEPLDAADPRLEVADGSGRPESVESNP